MMVAALRLAVCSVVINVALGQIKIEQPSSLVEKVGNEGKIAGSTTMLAAPTYETKIMGLLYYRHDETSQYCNPSMYDYIREVQSGNASAGNPILSKIVLVRHIAAHPCSLKAKVIMAQKQGADAVLAIDLAGRSEKTLLGTFWRGKASEPGKVDIPSVVVTKEVGNKLATAALAQTESGKMVVLSLNWNVPDKDTVTMVYAMSSGAKDAQRFLQSFADKRVSLGDRLIFEPEYDIKTKERHLDALQRKRSQIEPFTPAEKRQIIINDCIGPDKAHEMFTLDFHNESYCAMDPDGKETGDGGGKIKGRDVVMQDLLHHCVWRANHNIGEMSKPFWEFVKKLPDDCPLGEHSNIHCAHQLLDRLSINKDKVRECESVGETFLQEHSQNEWPASFFQINGWRYSGPPDAEEVFRAICHGYPEQNLPNPCKELFDQGSGTTKPGTNIDPEDIKKALEKVGATNFADLVAQLEEYLALMRQTTTTIPTTQATTAKPATTAETPSSSVAGQTTAAATTSPTFQGAVTRDEFNMLWLSMLIVVGGLFCALLIAALGCGMCLQARMMQNAAVRELYRAPLLGDNNAGSEMMA